MTKSLRTVVLLSLVLSLMIAGISLSTSAQSNQEGTPCTHVKISPPITTDDFDSGVNYPFLISANSEYAVYPVVRDDVFYDLYSSPVDGSTPAVQLANDLRHDGPDSFLISPDSQYVVYMNSTFELVSVPITGGAGTLLTGGAFGSAKLDSFEISPDSNYVVFIGNESDGLLDELFSVPITGGSPTRLNGTLDSGEDVEGFVIAPNASRVVYVVGDPFFADRLSSIPITGGTPTPLYNPNESAPEALQNNPTPAGVFITADSQTVVYALREIIISVPIVGGAITTLDQGLFLVAKVSPDGAYLVYTEDGPDNTRLLRSVPTGGGTPVTLNPPLSPFDEVDTTFMISADSSRVVFSIDAFAFADSAIYSVPISGGSTTYLVDGRPDFYVTAQNNLIYIDNFTLSRKPITGGNSVPLSPAGGTLQSSFVTNASGSHAVYNLTFPDFTDALYAVSESEASPVQINAEGEDYNGLSVQITPDGEYALFIVGFFDGSQLLDELYSTQICDGGDVLQPVRLHPADGDTLTGTDDWDWPRFSFQQMADVEWYQVWIGTDASTGYSTTALTQWYAATNTIGAPFGAEGICTAGVCTLPVDLWLGDGAYAWWMTYWGPTLQDIGGQWTESTFSVNFETPATAYTVTAPTGTIATAPDAITWERDTDVLWYQLWVGTDNYLTTAYFGWIDATQACDDSVCTLDTSTLSFPDGSYEIWLEAWGPGGYINWTTMTGNPATFSIGSSPVPPPRPARE